MGRRIFDVAIDGDVVLNDFDIFAAAGARTGLVESFNIVSDGTINIDLARVKREPTIAGIRITELNSAPAPNDPPAPNNAPTISDISNQTVNQNENVGPLNFVFPRASAGYENSQTAPARRSTAYDSRLLISSFSFLSPVSIDTIGWNPKSRRAAATL